MYKQVIFLAIVLKLYSISYGIVPKGFTFNAEHFDVGTMYTYETSWNIKEFSSESTYMIYHSDSNTIEMLTPSHGVLGVANISMNWNYLLVESSLNSNYPADYIPYGSGNWETYANTKNVINFNSKEIVTKGIKYISRNGIVSKENYSTVRPIEEPLPYGLGSFSYELALAVRYIDNPLGKTVFYGNKNGYNLTCVLSFEHNEVVSNTTTLFQCRKYKVKPEGLISSLLSKNSYIWIERESGYNYVVKVVDENQPAYEVRLSSRKIITTRAWNELKTSLIKKY